MFKKLFALLLIVIGLTSTGYGVYLFTIGNLNWIYLILSGIVLVLSGMALFSGRNIKEVLDDLFIGL